MTVRVILHGAFRDAMPRGNKRGITLHADTCLEVLEALEQHFPIKEMLDTTKGEMRLGKNYQRSKSLTAEQAGRWQLPEGATLHIGPHVHGHEITTAMLITAAISAAASIAATILINALMPSGTSEKDKRKNALYEGGLNTQTEGAVLAYLAGDRVFCGFNVIEASVDYTNNGGFYNVPPAKAALIGAVSGTNSEAIAQAFRGEKGGGKTISNTTQSDARLSVLGAIGAGEVGGIYGATVTEKEKNILINEVPLRDRGTGQYNYQGFGWTERPGVPGQSAVPITPGIPNNQDRTIDLRHSSSGGVQYVTEQVSDADVNRVKVRIRMNALVQTDKKGNQSRTSVQIGFETKRNSASAWQSAGSLYVNEKSSDPFVREWTVNAPVRTPSNDQDGWAFRVYRITADSNDDKLQNDTTFNGYVELKDEELPYDGSKGEVPTALFGASLDLATFDSGSYPEIALIMQGQKVRVPDNYDPVARTYSGTWSGAWKYAVTGNPVWHWYEIATSKTMGCGYPESFFNKFKLLNCAKYCDEKVNGRTRFTFNVRIDDEQDGWSRLQEIARTFRAIPFFNGSQIELYQDRPTTNIDHYINNAAVGNGIFTYASSPLRDQINECVVEWKDLNDYGRTHRVRYRDEASIARNRALGLSNNGIVTTTVAKLGCTNEQEAYDYARILVWSAQNENLTVEFDTSLAAAGYAPGQRIEIDDWNRSGKTPTGRIAEVVSGTQLRLDNPIPVKAGVSYQAHMVSGNKLTVRPVTVWNSATTTDLVTVDTSSIDADTPIGIIEVGGVQPRVFTIHDVVENGPGSYRVKGSLQVEGKYQFFDNNVPVQDSIWTQLNPKTPVPTGFSAKGHSWVNELGYPQHEIQVSWDDITPDYNMLFSGYHCQVRRPGSTTWEDVYKGNNSFAQLPNAMEGTHQFTVRTLNTYGESSAALTASYDFVYGESDNELLPPEFIGFD